MTFILSLPPALRMAIVFVTGTIMGAVVNALTYRWGYWPRAIGPWSTPHPAAPPRRIHDRLPVFGWIGMQRECPLHGKFHWIRPMLVELCLGFGLAWLYQFEALDGGLLSVDFPRPLLRPDLYITHAQFASHAVLIFWMLLATLIDLDDMIIPDAITAPGTLLGLIFAAAAPMSLLPELTLRNGAIVVSPVLLTSPNSWPTELESGKIVGLVIAVCCWSAWCFAMAPRTWYARHGIVRASALCWARMRRERLSKIILIAALVGVAAIVFIWNAEPLRWRSLLTALVGMAVGGGMIWGVRVAGALALKREAMGFGDVTLMGMIGAYLGWQACVVIFFLAPFVGLVAAILRLILVREKEIPYGPFLCMAALGVVLKWFDVWEAAFGVFSLGWAVPIVLLCCPAMLGVLLGLWRLIQSALRR